MARKNTSDMIEQYINELLYKDPEIELQRFEIASKFECVPSQINYVINTRFTISQGYQVESKRGGGGYIRITKIELQSVDVLSELSRIVDFSLTEKECQSLINQLVDYQLLTKNEAFLIMPFFETKCLNQTDRDRAELFQTLLERLTYKEKE